MAGGGDEAEFVGWRKSFNTVTNKGRLNLAYVSMAFWGSIFLAIKLRPSKSKALQDKK